MVYSNRTWKFGKSSLLFVTKRLKTAQAQEKHLSVMERLQTASIAHIFWPYKLGKKSSELIALMLELIMRAMRSKKTYVFLAFDLPLVPTIVFSMMQAT